jgi:hypothetical protein
MTYGTGAYAQNPWAALGFRATRTELAAGAGAFAFVGQAANFKVTEAATGGSFAFTGIEAVVTPTTVVAVDSGAFAATFNPANLGRTGADFESPSGGVGHYLLELEEAKRLARITRNPPPPLDLRTSQQFAPLAKPPIAPPTPAVDLTAIQQQRMAAEMQAAQAAKKRREIEALLLLAS